MPRKNNVNDTTVESNEESSTTVPSTTSNADHLKKFTVKHGMRKVDDNGTRTSHNRRVVRKQWKRAMEVRKRWKRAVEVQKQWKRAMEVQTQRKRAVEVRKKWKRAVAVQKQWKRAVELQKQWKIEKKVQRQKKLHSGKRVKSPGQLGDSWWVFGSWNKYIESEKLQRNSLDRDEIDFACGEPAGVAPWGTNLANDMPPHTDLSAESIRDTGVACGEPASVAPWGTNLANDMPPHTVLDAERRPRDTGVTVTWSEVGSRFINPVGNRSGGGVQQAHASNYVSMPYIELDEEPQWRSTNKRKRDSKADASTSIPSIWLEDDSNPSTEENADEYVRCNSSIETRPSKRSYKKRGRKPRCETRHKSPRSKKVAAETCGRSHVEADDSLIVVEERLQEQTDIDHPPPCESPNIEILYQKKKVFSKSAPSKDQTAVVNRRINSLAKSHTSNVIPMPANPMLGSQMLGSPMLGNQNIESKIVAKRMLGNPMLANQMLNNQILGNQMLGNTMLNNGNQMLGNPILGNPMLNNQMLGNQMVQQWQPMASAQQSTSQRYGDNYSNPPRQAQTGRRPIIIDGSNVAMGHLRSRSGSFFSSRGLEICINYFLERNHKVHAFVPLYRRSDSFTLDSWILDDLEQERHLIFTPSRYVDGRTIVPYDDRYIVQTAAELGGVIVSRDNFRDLLDENPKFDDVLRNRLLMFTWVGDMIMFPKDPLGEDGPTLDQFLRF